MAFWDVDLTTRDGAQGAVRSGSTAAFVFAAMGILGAVLMGGLSGPSTDEGLGVIVGGSFEAVIGLVAGLRMRAGKGFYWAIAAALLLALELVGKLVMLSPGGAILSAVVLTYLVNGIRGLRALKHEVGYEDADVDVFS